MRVAMLLTNHHRPDPRVYHEASALALEHDVTVFAWDRDRKGPAEEDQDGVHVVRIMTPGSYGSLRGLVAGLPRFYRAALREGRRRGPFDVVHAHDFDTLPLGVRWVRRLGGRLVYDTHEFYRGKVRHSLPLAERPLARLEDRWARRAAAVLVVNRFLERHFQSVGARTALVPNTKTLADYDRVSAQAIKGLRSSWGAAKGDYVVSYFGLMIKDRNLHAFLEAAGDVPGVYVVLAGEGELRAGLEELARQVLPGRHLWLDAIPQREMPKATLACDAVFCCYSPVNPNNLYGGPPGKMFEAIAAGRPCIVSDQGVAGEFVLEAGNGVTCDGSRQGIATALRTLVAGGDEARRVERQTREARHRFNWERSGAELRQVYRSLA